MAELAARHRAVAVDVGTGDGAYARRLAAADPSLLVVGVDANADKLRPASRRAAAAPARGGLPNLRFGRLALEHAPGALAGLADRLTVILPWGSLLRAVAAGEPDGLGRLRALCAPGAEVEIVFGDRDLDGVPAEALPARYADAGLELSARYAGAAEVAALGTTWAKRLVRSDPDRRFHWLTAVAAPHSLPFDARPQARCGSSTIGTRSNGAMPGSAPRTGS